MRIAVIGLGVQGRKRCAVAGDLVTVTVDPVAANAQYRTLREAPLDAGQQMHTRADHFSLVYRKTYVELMTLAQAPA